MRLDGESSQCKEAAVHCCLAIVALLAPRVLMVFIWLLTHWFSQAYHTVIWPALGFLFMPYATLAYMAAMLNNNHVLGGWWLALFIAAIVVDVGHWGGGGRSAYRWGCA
jgi:hypothetical protein